MKKNKKKIYIAGKVTGEEIAKCTMKFGGVQAELEEMGFEAVNPLEVVGTFKTTWEAAMKKCITALMDCDAVLFLPCASDSEGARLEFIIAERVKIPLFMDIKQLNLWMGSLQPTP